MSKQYRETVDVEQADGRPTAFRWRGATYRVLAVAGYWREDASWWAAAGLAVPQRELWRVEARNGTPAVGVYELVRDDGRWRLGRVWD